MSAHDEMKCQCEACQGVRQDLFRPGTVQQPDPIPNASEPIVDLVIDDMIDRKSEGVKRYGVPLQANNGRDALMDAYHEALDLCMYLRQAIEERKVAA